MSHRVVNATELTDLDLVTKAANHLKWSINLATNRHVQFNSGPLNWSALDTKTGEMSFDSDHRSRIEQGLNQLRPHYARQKVLAEFMLKGVMVECEDVDEKGNIRIYASQ